VSPARLALAALVASLAASGAAAQGLGDAAARARQKRQAQASRPAEPPKKVFTNDDLSVGGETTTAAGGEPAASGEKPGGVSAAPVAAAEPATSEKAPALSDPVERERHERALLEAHWRERFAIARERLAVADARAWVDAYKIEFVNGVPYRVLARERVETDELRRAKEAMAALEEEFRRTGLPAGWARQP
jgi:hypothetical protein